nr:hypothetical protein Iba_scaffold7622CG0010 [Ipomoea batatas]
MKRRRKPQIGRHKRRIGRLQGSIDLLLHTPRPLIIIFQRHLGRILSTTRGSKPILANQGKVIRGPTNGRQSILAKRIGVFIIRNCRKKRLLSHATSLLGLPTSSPKLRLSSQAAMRSLHLILIPHSEILKTSIELLQLLRSRPRALTLKRFPHIEESVHPVTVRVKGCGNKLDGSPPAGSALARFRKAPESAGGAEGSSTGFLPLSPGPSVDGGGRATEREVCDRVRRRNRSCRMSCRAAIPDVRYRQSPAPDRGRGKPELAGLTPRSAQAGPGPKAKEKESPDQGRQEDEKETQKDPQTID